LIGDDGAGVHDEVNEDECSYTWIFLVGDDETGPHDEVDEYKGVVGKGQQIPGHRNTLHERNLKSIKIFFFVILPSWKSCLILASIYKVVGLTYQYSFTSDTQFPEY